MNALRVIKVDPSIRDADLVTGLNEYIFGRLPLFIRWVGRFDQVQGDKRLGIEQLRLAAGEGRYLRALAKILLPPSTSARRGMKRLRRLPVSWLTSILTTVISCQVEQAAEEDGVDRRDPLILW